MKIATFVFTLLIVQNVVYAQTPYLDYTETASVIENRVTLRQQVTAWFDSNVYDHRLVGDTSPNNQGTYDTYTFTGMEQKPTFLSRRVFTYVLDLRIQDGLIQTEFRVTQREPGWSDSEITKIFHTEMTSILATKGALFQ